MFHYCLDGDIEGVKKYIANVKDINWRNKDFGDEGEGVSTYMFHTGFRNIKTRVSNS